MLRWRARAAHAELMIPVPPMKRTFIVRRHLATKRKAHDGKERERTRRTNHGFAPHRAGSYRMRFRPEHRRPHAARPDPSFATRPQASDACDRCRGRLPVRPPTFRAAAVPTSRLLRRSRRFRGCQQAWRTSRAPHCLGVLSRSTCAGAPVLPPWRRVRSRRPPRRRPGSFGRPSRLRATSHRETRPAHGTRRPTKDLSPAPHSRLVLKLLAARSS